MRLFLITLTLFSFLLLSGCTRATPTTTLTPLPPTVTLTLTPTLSSPRQPSPIPLSPMPTPTDSQSQPSSESPSAASNATPEPTPAAKGEPSLHPLGAQTPESAISPQISEAAKRLAAETLQIEPSRLEITQIEAVTWPDASLGCPQEGYLYAQVLTPGYKAILAAGEETVEVHLDARGQGVACPLPE